MNKLSPRSIKGFTLLEVLVALAIVAIVALLSWEGLQEVLRMRDRLNLVDDRLQTTTAIFSQLEQDIATVERATPKGQLQPDGVTLSSNGLLILHTIRRPDIPTAQRQTAWVWQDNALVRVSRLLNETDREIQSDPLILKGVKIRLWQEGQGWTPPQKFGTPANLEYEEPNYVGRPNPLQPTQNNNLEEGNAAEPVVRAVEVLVTQSNGQSLLRVFNLGGVY